MTGWFGIVHSLIKWGFMCGLAYIAYKAVAVLAGKTTLADIQFVVSILQKSSTAGRLSWMLAGVSSLALFVATRLYRKNLSKKAARIRELERILDRKRSSSRLNHDGTTRTEDQA